LNSKKHYESDQEIFWAGSFGDEYISRNQSAQLLASNLSFFAKSLDKIERVHSCIEFGANVGMNLRALKLLFPESLQYGIEINSRAADELRNFLSDERVFEGSILDFNSDNKWDLVLIKGVLIHTNPDLLPIVYEKLTKASKKYILIAEYYNPTPMSIPYRGFNDRLFKRDFTGEILDKFHEFHLLDYGFSYHRDPLFPQDDINWFLLKKD